MALTKKYIVPLPVKVEYCPVSDVASYTRVHDVYAEILLNTGKVFNEFYSSPGSIEFSHKSGSKPAGIFYQTQVKLFFPGVDPETEAILFLLDRLKVILKVYFSDNSIRYVGSPEAPVRITAETLQNNSRAGTTITCDVQSTEKPRFLVAEDNIIPPPEL